MREKNFTEGDWTVASRETNGVSGYEIHWSPDGECVTDHVYTIYDANIISASKELLEALETMVECYGINRKYKYGPPDDPQISAARQAIKKAYGETE